MKMTDANQAMIELTTSWQREGIEIGRKEGLEEGHQQGERDLLIRQFKHRFGEPGPELEAQIKALSREEIEDLCIAMLDFKSRNEIISWLEKH